MAKRRKKRGRQGASGAALKRCTRCRESKELTEFGRDRSRGDGLRAKCKECEYECQKTRRERLQNRTPAQMPKSDFKRCSKCGEVKPMADFCLNRSNTDGYTNACRLCEQKKARAYHRRVAARRKSEIPRIKAKKCPKCGETKTVSEFYKAVGKVGGYATLCKDCARIGAAQRRNEIADRDFADIALTRRKKCWMCGRTMPASEFNYSRSVADGLTSSCRECNREYKQQHYEENHGEYYNRQLRHRREHPEMHRAFAIVSEAIRTGELNRPEVCSNCGKIGTIIAHHDDYGRPLDVTWLCIRCDRQLHADLRREERRSRLRGVGRS